MHKHEVVVMEARTVQKSNINVYSLCHHECQNTGDFCLDHIRLPRFDTNQLVSSTRMRLLQV